MSKEIRQRWMLIVQSESFEIIAIPKAEEKKRKKTDS